MSKKNIITLKKIALDLGVSISTVSRALSNHQDISDSTKEKVNVIAKKLNYVPNLFAKGFRTHKTNIIGVIVPNIDHYFTSTLLKGVMHEAEKQGYKVIISESNNNEQRQTEMLYTMNQFGVDGILLSLANKTKKIDAILDILERTPLILFDKVSTKVPCTQIVIDDEDAAFKAVEHLIHMGKKRIAIIKDLDSSFISEKRYLGYLRALKKHQIEVDENIILSANEISLAQGQLNAAILLKLPQRPDAIFAITDDAAVGVIKILKQNHIKIPEDIAVVGFSNSINSTIIEPNLTTIDQPGNKIGEVAVQYLLNEIRNEQQFLNKTIVIRTNLIVRDSSFKT
ncbi:MAG: LacI family transcriptional regulator [Lutibacter sp. BRH_c52]|nr:MAG: LacI family transcriptional regulator [Lutibacter sp. BRH_c52]